MPLFQKEWNGFYGELKAKLAMKKAKEMFGGVTEGNDDGLPMRAEPERPEVGDNLTTEEYKQCLKEAREIQASLGRPHNKPKPKPPKKKR